MKKFIWLYITAILFVAYGCDDEDVSDDIIVSKDYIKVAPSLSLLGDGQDAELKITANCSWTISNNASWLSVTPSSGSNSETIKVSAGKNSTGQERSATLTIQAGTAPTRSVVVTQPIGKTLSANLSTLSFEAKGESKSLSIISNTSWTLSKPDWCTLSASSGNGNADIVVTALENSSKDQRSGQIVVSGEGVSSVTISVSQKGKDITLSVNVNSLSFEAKEETKSFTISSNTSWTISKPDWCTLSASSGNGNAVVVVTASENPSKEQRSGQIVVSGEGVSSVTISVSQKGKDITLSVNVSSFSFEAKEESKSFSISSNTSWMITKPDWCTLSASSGNGNADIVVTVSENPSKEQRSGQIVISGEGANPVTISVSQKGKDTTNSQEPGSDDNLPPS